MMILTWYETAEKRPRHMNWETLTPTAHAQDSPRKVSAGTFQS